MKEGMQDEGVEEGLTVSLKTGITTSQHQYPNVVPQTLGEFCE